MFTFSSFSFASNYKNRVWRNEVMMRKQERGIQEKQGTGNSDTLTFQI